MRLIDLLLHWWKVAPIAPKVLPAEAKCCHCGEPAKETWWPGFCSLAGEPKQWMPVCTPCDIILNETNVRFLFGSSKDHLLASYRRRRLP
jgi:hypothetical protein